MAAASAAAAAAAAAAASAAAAAAKNGLSVERVLSSTFRVLTADAARSILRIKIAKGARDRAQQLGMFTKKRALTPAERSELEFYLQLGSLLTFLHSKARMALRPPAPRTRRKSA